MLTHTEPMSLQIILEGQEEIGSPDLPAFLRKHKRQLAADTVVSADGGQISEDQVWDMQVHDLQDGYGACH